MYKAQSAYAGWFKWLFYTAAQQEFQCCDYAENLTEIYF